MNFVDVKTILFSYLVSSLLCTGFLAVLWWQYRKRFAGITFWLGDYAIQTIGLSLVALRGVISDWISMIVGNLFIIGGAILLFIGLERFLDKRGKQIQHVVLLLVFTLVHCYFVIFEPSLAARNLNLSLSLLVICAQASWLLLQRTTPELRSATKATGIVFLIYCIVCLARITTVTFLPQSNDLFQEANSVDPLFLITFQILLISLTFSLFFMISQRLSLEIQDGNKRYQQIFIEHSAIQLLVNPITGDIIDANPAASSFYGYSIPILQKMNIAQINTISSEELTKALQEIKNRKTNHFVFPHRIASGAIREVEVYSSPITIKGQTLLHSIINDITEQKRTREAQAKLEQKINQMQKLDSLGVLAGGIAHDFNNLLGGIFGHIEIALGLTQDQKVSRYLEKALSTMERANALTMQLLTFAKGGTPIKKVGALFPFAKETARFALSGANVSMECDIQGDLWLSKYDKNQIAQVIDNLMINAQQAMPTGGKIKISAQNLSFAENQHAVIPAGNYIKISIKDSGTGIQQELIDKIFDPFFSTKPKAHGLGLATCYSIIKRHDGHIEVESEVGKGSTFHLFLPAFSSVPLEITEEPALEHCGSGTFLIMDDEEVMREAIGGMLQSLGYSVAFAENGNEALAFVATEIKSNRKISGMIFDLTVPGGMGGREAISEVRKLDSEVPVFVVSGYAENPIMANPQKYGFTASLCKPFKKIELVHLLNKHINSSTTPITSDAG